MKYDIILAGVGGQGVLSVAAVIAGGAVRERLFVKQSEVHGMSQRGGAVMSHLRLSDQPVSSDLIAEGTAAMVLAMEPLESLRYVKYLSPDGVLVTSTNPVRNISDYPELDGLLDRIKSLTRQRLVDAQGLAKEAGSTRATNMVMVGAAAAGLPVKTQALEQAIRDLFASKGEEIVEINLRAFRLGCLKQAAWSFLPARLQRLPI